MRKSERLTQKLEKLKAEMETQISEARRRERDTIQRSVRRAAQRTGFVAVKSSHQTHGQEPSNRSAMALHQLTTFEGT